MKDVIPPEDRFKLILSLYVIFIKEGETLLLRRQNTGYEDGNYGLPAGHADGDESARDGACREALEEVGVVVKPRDLEFVHVMHRRQEDERVDIFFSVKKWEGEPKNTEPHRCDDVSWFAFDKLPENTIPYIRQALEATQKGIKYSEFGW